MSARLAAAIVVLALLGGLAYWLLGGAPGQGPAPTGPAVPAAPGDPEAAGAGVGKALALGRAWLQRGTGSVEGILREFGTDRPLGGVKVRLAAGVPGPGIALEAATLADGSFLVEKAPNFDAWTLTAAVPAPLAEVEVPGVEVIEGRVTRLGVLYATPGFTVPGVVVDEAGGPVAGAVVRAIRGRPASVKMDFLRVIRELPRPYPAVESVVTGPDGRFALKKLVPGPYDIEVGAKGFRTTVEKDRIVTPEAAGGEIRVVLGAGHVLKGRVVRRTEGPLAGLRVVCCVQPNDEREMFGVVEKGLGLTGETGEFTIDGLGAGVHFVAVETEGEPYYLGLNVNIPHEGTLEIVLEGDATLEGKVSDPEKGPLAGAQVYIVDFRGGSPSVGFAVTDAEGRYALRSLKSGPVQLFMVQAEGYGVYPEDFMSVLQGGGSDLVLVPGRNEKDVSLGRGGIVRGLVREQGTENPVEGVRVSLASVSAFFGGQRSGTTNAEGRFEITSVPMGGGLLVASKDGWAQPGINPQSMAAMAMAVMTGGKRPDPGKGISISITEPGEVVERTLEMARGSNIRGTVLSPAGDPVQGARVSVEFATAPGGRMRELAAFIPLGEPRLSGPGGVFEIPSPASGQKIVVTARAQGFLDGRSEPMQTKAGEPLEGAVVKLREGAVLEGKVTGPGGKPVAGALVRHVAAAEGDDWGRRWRLENARPHQTDAAGAFRIPNVEPGRLTVQFTHPSHVSASRDGVEAVEGRATEVSAELGGALTLSGKVLGPDGKPFVGARIEVNRQGDLPEGADPYFSPPGNLASSSDGSFTQTGLLPGTYSLKATAEGAADSDPVEAEAGGPAVTLRLAQAFSISGTVRLRQGAGLGNVRVRAKLEGKENDNGWDNSTSTNREGRFEIRDLPAGTYEVLVEAGWGTGRPNLVPVTVKGVVAGTGDLLVEAEEGLKISGTVLKADGTPVPEGWIGASRIPAPGETDGASNANAAVVEGKFELVGLKPGKYRLNVGGQNLPGKQVEAEAGGENVRIQYGQGGGIDGRVLRPDGSPAVGAWVSAHAPEGNSWSRCGADGRYSLRELPPGTYTVSSGWNAGERNYSGRTEGIQVATGSNAAAPDISLEENR